MPQESMDWWVIFGVLVAVVGVYYARRQLKSSAPKTKNEIKGGNRNKQEGSGSGSTVNRIEDGDDNEQKG